MRRNTKGGFLLLISDPYKALYQDRWENKILHYTGMGPEGDQSLEYSQNKTLAQAPSVGTKLHLCEAYEPKKYTYLGEVDLVAPPYQEEQLDRNGDPRRVWMFAVELRSGAEHRPWTLGQLKQLDETMRQKAKLVLKAKLKQRAKAAGGKPSRRTATVEEYYRSPLVAAHVLEAAGGRCDLCGQDAPFKKRNGDPFLECHHVIWLSKGGLDAVDNCVALCPNCHRKMHTLNRKEDRQKLQQRITRRGN